MTLKAKEHMTEGWRSDLYSALRCVQGGPITLPDENPNNVPTELHHGGVHNTTGNRQNFPLLMHSPLNVWMLSKAFHEKNSGYGRYPRDTAQELEKILHSIYDLAMNHTVEPERLIAAIGMILDFADKVSSQNKRKMVLVG